MTHTTASAALQIRPTHVFYRAGSMHAIDEIHPITGKGLYSGRTQAEIEAEGGPVEIVTHAEATQRANAAALTAPAQITAERYDDALNVLPPQRWVRRDGAESFQFLEKYCGNVTSVYVKLGSGETATYWSWRDYAGKPHELLCAKAAEAKSTLLGS